MVNSPKNDGCRFADAESIWYNSNMRLSSMKSIVALVALCCAVLSSGAAPAVAPNSLVRYATDAYPGFDLEENILKVEKKTPSFFTTIMMRGPKMKNAAEQFRYARSLEAAGSYSSAVNAFDALVMTWPTAPEAWQSQKAIADIYSEKLNDPISAFDEYKYLADFFSSECDYDDIVLKMYETAKTMRLEGKTVVFFRFANTVDVRRAFEAVVLRAPGAAFAPKAMLAVADLRVEEGEYGKAISVYENLRNIYATSPEAVTALRSEGYVRMKMLREHEYNRSRCRDTISFLRATLAANPDVPFKQEFQSWIEEATTLLEDEAFRATKFYDSRTRTRRSAICAYERFIARYPASSHVGEAKRRLAELQKLDEHSKILAAAESAQKATLDDGNKANGSSGTDGGAAEGAANEQEGPGFFGSIGEFFAKYSWRSQVPEELRAINVGVFRNESNVTGIGAEAARQILREIQREGTYKIADNDDCSLEIQGTIVKCNARQIGYNRTLSSTRNNENIATMVAKVSVIDKKQGKVIVENRVYEASTTFIATDDVSTKLRDASGRLCEDLALQVVDDLILMNW